MSDRGRETQMKERENDGGKGNDAIQQSLVRIGGRQRASRSRCGLAFVEGRVGGGGYERWV